MRTNTMSIRPRPGTWPLAVVFALSLSAAGQTVLDDTTASGLDGYLQRGLEAAQQAKGALGGNLVRAIESGGPEGAVAFCNTRAAPIAEEVSATLGVAVTRVSDRPRNPVNAAGEEALAVIADFKAALASGGQPRPQLREHGSTIVGYYPIVTNGMCLQCHGVEGLDVSPATQRVIDSLYPDDRATGYGVNELRGLFVVSMDREPATGR